MNRFQFRAWHRINQHMYAHKNIPVGLKNMANDNVWTYMQFIGLKDKNKVDIYEGDILELIDFNGKTIRVVAEWGIHRREMASGFWVDIPGFCFKSGDFPSFPIIKNYSGKHDLEIMEVIGNIYEHKHLLL